MTLQQETPSQAAPATPKQAQAADAAKLADKAVKNATDAVNNALSQGHPVLAQTAPPAPSTSVPPDFPSDIPGRVENVAYGFMFMVAVIAVGFPLARALGRRLERPAITPSVSPGTTEQLQRIEQAVDAMAIEIERISESQRFMAKLQSASASDQASLPANRG